jgi:hypothetical protein
VGIIKYSMHPKWTGHEVKRKTDHRKLHIASVSAKSISIIIIIIIINNGFVKVAERCTNIV